MARVGEEFPFAWPGIQPDQLRLLLLMIRPARPTLAEVPLADLSFDLLPPAFTPKTPSAKP